MNTENNDNNENPAEINLGDLAVLEQEPVENDPDSVLLHESAARDYLEYAVAVVKGRALPSVKDGQKPVQRRVLFAMHELGLASGAKPVKSARVVGDVIGKYHPHGDSSVYDAMVRIAQDFSLRYPLVDGQGNFGSRDGDNAAAMRYTEARLTPIAALLLNELAEGTVDFQDNYDGAFNEPVFLPSRLPFLLLNGASGIAVGMATEMPSHNLGEIAQAAIHKIEYPEADLDALLTFVKGPDYAGGGQIISSQTDIKNAYETGRGSMRVRASYAFEELARGAWQLVFNELPPSVSTAKVLLEIGNLTNPQPKIGKKAIEQSAAQLKALFTAQIDRVRDESGKEFAVRLVFEPVSSRQSKDEFLALLLAHTSLETSAPINLVAVGLDGRPCQKNLLTLLDEWCTFRLATVKRRTAHRLQKAEDRIHILEGRHIVFVHMDEVIRLIRETDEPKAELMRRYQLSERQAEDILEIRLRQLARLEGIRIEEELSKLRETQEALNLLLADDKRLRRLVISEIKEDAAKFADPRRTLIKTEEMVSRSEVANIANEPVTLIISDKGFARARQGHKLDLSAVSYKDGDKEGFIFECRSVDSLIVISNEGRSFEIAVSQLPDGRGMGSPISSFIDLAGSKIAQLLVAAEGFDAEEWLFAKTSGYGFICTSGDLKTRQKAGKAFMTMEESCEILSPCRVLAQDIKHDHLAALSSDGRLLVFPQEQMKRLGGGKGVQIINLKGKEALADVKTIIGQAVDLIGVFRNREKILPSEEKHTGQRARRGALVGLINAPKIKEADTPVYFAKKTGAIEGEIQLENGEDAPFTLV